MAQFSFSYDAGTQTYALRDGTSAANFPASSKTNETSVPDYYPRVEYRLSSPTSEDDLITFKQSNSNPPIPIAYSSYGVWQHNDSQAGATRVRLDYFTNGTPTATASMPHSGTAVYRIAGTGNYATDKELYFTESYETMTVDFATGKATLNLSLTGSDFLNDVFGGIISASYSGQIVGNGADGALVFAYGDLSGVLHVSFFGPNAQEAGIVYSASSPTQVASFNGAGVGVTP